MHDFLLTLVILLSEVQTHRFAKVQKLLILKHFCIRNISNVQYLTPQRKDPVGRSPDYLEASDCEGFGRVSFRENQGAFE